MALHDAGRFIVKEINRLKILQDVIDRNLRPGQAAQMPGITPRHCSRLLNRYLPSQLWITTDLAMSWMLPARSR